MSEEDRQQMIEALKLLREATDKIQEIVNKG